MLEELLIGGFSIGAVLRCKYERSLECEFFYFWFYRFTLFGMQIELRLLFSYLLGWPKWLLRLSIQLKLGIGPRKPFCF